MNLEHLVFMDIHLVQSKKTVKFKIISLPGKKVLIMEMLVGIFQVLIYQLMNVFVLKLKVHPSASPSPIWKNEERSV